MMRKSVNLAVLVGVASVSAIASADVCVDVSRAAFKAAVSTAYSETLTTGFGLGMWATLVDDTGKVCHVYSVDGAGGASNAGADTSQTAWLGSRVISAQKANTANAFSLSGLAISTGAITVATYEGGSLFGLQASNPVNADIVYEGSAGTLGTNSDSMKGKRPGGINLFGGGVALYDGSGAKVGAVGVSGDTSCRDHTMAYRVRIALGLNNEPNDDGLELVDTTMVPLTALFQQPACGVADPAVTVYQAANDNGVR
ncbi:MAG: heme-binding protein [Methylophagaceae bacterium]